jgi:hypothetical protein
MIATIRTAALLTAFIVLLAACTGPNQAAPTRDLAGSPNNSLERHEASNPPEKLKRVSAGWTTNWNKHTVPYDEIISGGPPRDGIPSIDAPKFISQGEAQKWLKESEPVIALEMNRNARAYPLQILMWHEIVNDKFGDIPVLITFCPLCNSAITFERTIDEHVYEFGTSGLLRHSDLIMYDRSTESLWQQFTGEAIVGDLVGKKLKLLPSSIVSFGEFQKAYPQGQVMSRNTGFTRNYGQNPYVGYDSVDSSPFLYSGETDSRLLPMERVVTVSLAKVDVAYPVKVLRRLGVIHDQTEDQELVVFYQPGANSALDSSTISEGRDVGSTGVFSPVLDGESLSFRRDGETIKDLQTESTWNIFGQAIDGPMTGKRLAPIVHGDLFWFAWAAFKPDTIIFREK